MDYNRHNIHSYNGFWTYGLLASIGLALATAQITKNGVSDLFNMLRQEFTPVKTVINNNLPINEQNSVLNKRELTSKLYYKNGEFRPILENNKSDSELPDEFELSSEGYVYFPPNRGSENRYNGNFGIETNNYQFRQF